MTSFVVRVYCTACADHPTHSPHPTISSHQKKTSQDLRSRQRFRAEVGTRRCLLDGRHRHQSGDPVLLAFADEVPEHVAEGDDADEPALLRDTVGPDRVPFDDDDPVDPHRPEELEQLPERVRTRAGDGALELGRAEGEGGADREIELGVAPGADQGLWRRARQW